MKYAIQFLPAISILFCGFHAFGQSPQEVQISTEGTLNSDNCQEYFILTDSNADNGNYLENEDFETTLCFNDIEMSNAQVQILPTNIATGNVWDLDENSSLFIYEGNSTAGDLLGEFNSFTDPNGVFFTTESQCLTFVFVSGEGSTGMGFVAEFKCVEPLQPFEFDVEPEAPLVFADLDIEGIPASAHILTICYGDTINLNAVLDFPLSDATGNGYEQSVENTLITYNWGDGSTDAGMGLVSASHAYEPFGGFYIYVSAQDEMGQLEFTEVFVLVAPRPNFSGILLNDTLCQGDATQLTGGILNEDTVGVGPSTGLVNINYEFNDSLALPDGSGVLYSTSIDVAGYAGGPTLNDPGDLVSICINVEHSYLGDLEAWITCPNGSTALLFDGYSGPGLYPNGQNGFGGGSTYLGDPVEGDEVNPIPGVGFDYCFSDVEANLGTMEEEFDNGNTVPVTLGNAMVAGTYLPGETFENLNGCPLNGPWTLNFADNIFSDNGFVFGWDITFSDEYPRDSIYYSPDIVDAYWLDNADIVENNDTIITVVPSQPGYNQFTFVAEDSFGCLHDTTFLVYVRPMPVINDAIACDQEWELFPSNVPDEWEWNTISTPTEIGEAVFEDLQFGAANVSVNEYGIFEFEITEFNCMYRDTAAIDFRPVPQIEPFVEDTVLCVGGSINFAAGPQEANSGNFNIVWTLNGDAFNTEDYDVTVDQTGQYILTIVDVCGSATDTSDVVAIQLMFEGDTVCGLNAVGDVTLAPEGSGSWSSIASVISFDMPNELTTEINSSDYGVYPVTFTDSRCPNDGVTHVFRFVEQPVIDILPQNPDFCVELDSLIISTNVSGSFTGDYFWDIIGPESPQIIHLDDSLFFAPETFVPLETYQINVQIFDPFSVCNVATGSTSFETVWCTYNIPNVITPNGDGFNDLFVINGIEYFPETHLTIFNRWGNVVFDQANYDQYQAQNLGWKPEDLSGGTYFFELRLPQVQKLETGNITILKDN